MLSDVSLRILIVSIHAVDVARLKRGERHREVVAGLQRSVRPEVLEALTLLLGHVIAVGLVGVAVQGVVGFV